VTSAAQARWSLKHNPINNRIYNPINNPINGPINNLKKKRTLIAASLQVRDDPRILETEKMSPGTSASVSVLTDVDWDNLQA